MNQFLIIEYPYDVFIMRQDLIEKDLNEIVFGLIRQLNQLVNHILNIKVVIDQRESLFVGFNQSIIDNAMIFF